MKLIHFNSSAGLSSFCRDLSNQIKISASKIKHGIAKLNGHAHVSTFVAALDSQNTIKLTYFDSSADFSSLCCELSRHINVPASKIKNGIAKLHGHARTATFVENLDAQSSGSRVENICFSESSWLKIIDALSGVNPRESFSLAAKSVFTIILRCIDAAGKTNPLGYSGAGILSLTNPSVLIRASLDLYISTDNDDVKDSIKTVIGNLPGLIFEQSVNEARLGLDLSVSGLVTEHLGYLTMQIDSAVDNFYSFFWGKSVGA